MNNNNNNIVALNPTRSIYSIVGNLCNNPEILKNPTYIIGARDFVQEFHKIVYGAINQLALSNKKIDHITPIDIDNFLAAYPVYYKIWDENNGINYVKDAKDHANEEVFESDYNRLKKYSLLRNYMEIGIDVSDVYDYKSLNLSDQNESSEKLESMSTSDIIEYYTQKMINIRDEWNIEEGVVLDFKAGDGLDTLLERIQEAPDFGFPFPNSYYNSLFRGMREGKFLLRSGSTGTGKAIVHGTRIPTLDGWKLVEDIKLGDKLFDRTGKPTNVVGVYPQGKQEVYRVKLKDGRYVDCNAEHLWEVITLKGTRKTITTLEMIDIMNNHKKAGRRGFPLSIPANEAVEYEEKVLPVDPYVLGAILGDGCITKENMHFSISSEDDIIPNEIAKILNTTFYKNEHNYTYLFYTPEDYNNDGHKFNKKYLYNYDVFNNLKEIIGCRSDSKYIPEEYLISSKQQRLRLLQGLLDTDGSVSKRDESRQNNLSYYSTSVKLLKQVSELAHSLGYSNSIIMNEKEGGKGGLIYFNVSGSEIENLLFAPTSKMERAKESNKIKGKAHRDRIKVVSIEKLNYKEDQVCFTVDNEESLFLVGEYVVTHNTRQAIRDMCNVACDAIYKTGYGWQSLGESYPALFISTELDKDEVQLIMLAYITGIPDDVIKNGNYDNGTANRLEEGLKILQRAPLFASYIEDFSISDIEMKIEQYIINHHVKYVAFDYIQMVPKLSKTMQHSFGQNLREDQILVNFASALKNISTRYNIFLESSTQLNRGSKEIENRDASSLRGGWFRNRLSLHFKKIQETLISGVLV